MATEAPRVTCHDYGDAAVRVDIEGGTYDDRWDVARRLGVSLPAAGIRGLVDVVSTFQHVVVSFDPLLTDAATMRSAAVGLAGRPGPARVARRFRVPVVYGGEHGPDLDDVAVELSLSPAGLIDLHTSGDWIVRFTGSPVGAPFMDGPDVPRGVARMREPRARVPSGAVAMSGRQSMIYPAASPGGWRLIGRTPARLFDTGHEPPMPYAAGDVIRFVAIDAASWDERTTRLEAYA